MTLLIIVSIAILIVPFYVHSLINVMLISILVYDYETFFKNLYNNLIIIRRYFKILQSFFVTS